MFCFNLLFLDGKSSKRRNSVSLLIKIRMNIDISVVENITAKLILLNFSKLCSLFHTIEKVFTSLFEVFDEKTNWMRCKALAEPKKWHKFKLLFWNILILVKVHPGSRGQSRWHSSQCGSLHFCLSWYPTQPRLPQMFPIVVETGRYPPHRRASFWCNRWGDV